jgi:signal transduction histidine kinase
MRSVNRFMITNLVFSCAALVLVLLSFFSYQRLNKQAEASDVVSHTQLLKFKLNDAFSHLIKTETAQRGFILTRDSVFLFDYFFAKKAIPGILSEIETLVTNDTEQQSNLEAASDLFQLRLKYIHRTLRQSQHISRTALDSTLLKGEQITDSLSRQIEKMIKTEDYLLGQRITAMQDEERTTSFFILLFSAISIAILTFSFYKLKRETFNNSQLEQKVQERTEEIKRTNEILNKQNLELKRKNDELSSFTFIANHDLKEPLRKIEFFINRVFDSEEALSAPGRKFLDKSIDCLKRMKILLEDIFIYTLADKAIGYETTDLNEIAEKAIGHLQEIIDEKKATVICKQLPVVNAIPRQMEQVFTNILSNSLKYSRKNVKPQITIEAQRLSDDYNGVFWKISFTDNGIGFDEALSEKVFGMFQRLHLKGEYPGTGMGLTICRKIVENHGGSITASSKNGDSAIFTILLPENKN